nr:hypothetical protein [Thiolapillus sp.]
MRFIESVSIIARRVVWLYLLEASQRRALEMATFSIVRLDVEPLKAALSSWMVVAPFFTQKPQPDFHLLTDPSV